MATTTARLSLTKPDPLEDVDVALLNADFDTLDNAVGALVCTSTTRPSTPFLGQLIWQADSPHLLIWVGSWVTIV
jgi:hypothetical protein